MCQLKLRGYKMKTHAGQLNLVTLTRVVSCSGLDEIMTAMVKECKEKVSGRIYTWLFISFFLKIDTF